jgi:hypothetical protein
VPDYSHRERSTTAARGVCAYLIVNLVVRQLYFIFSLTSVGKWDNMWPISTNWTIRCPSVQIEQYVVHQYKLDNTWPLSTNWTIRGHSVQIGQYVTPRYKLDNMWPISTNWTILGPSVQIGQYDAHQYKLDNTLFISTNQ